MMRALAGVGGGVAVLGLSAGVYVSSMPDVLHCDRTVEIEATVDQVVPMLIDHREFVQWSPWSERDPDQETRFSDPSSGVGSWYTWSGDDEVGAGRMEVRSIADREITVDLEFIEPFPAKALVTYTLEPVGDTTRVTWAMDQPADFATKMAMASMDMDAMLGADFEYGLERLAAHVDASVAAMHAEQTDHVAPDVPQPALIK